MELLIVALVVLQSEKLNPPLPRDPGTAGGDVRSAVLSPDATWVVYTADQDANEVLELYSVPSDASASSRKLSSGTSATFFQPRVTSTGTRVVYRSDEAVAGIDRLYSVPVDGSAAPLHLDGSMPSGREVSAFELSPDGARALYLSNELSPSSFVHFLFSVPSDGSSARVRLDTGTNSVVEARFTSDGSRIVYRQLNASRTELYGVPSDGSGAPVRLDSTTVLGGNVMDFELSSDGSAVVYRADQTVDDRLELFSVPVSGGSAVGLTPGFNLGFFTKPFSLSPSGLTVAFTASEGATPLRETFAVPRDAAQAPVRVHAAGASSELARFSSDGARILFTWSVDGATELYSVPTDLSASPVKLVDLPAARTALVRDVVGSRVVFKANVREVNTFDLYSVPVDGSLQPALLALKPAGSGAIGPLSATASGERYLYLEFPADPNASVGLWSIPLDGSAPAVRVNGTLAAHGEFHGLVGTSADGLRAFYLAEEAFDEVVELWNGPVLGGSPALRLNATLPVPPIVGDVGAFGWSPEGHDVAYLADQDFDNVPELYAVRMDPTRLLRKWNAPLFPVEPPASIGISPLSGRPCLFALGGRVFYAKSSSDGVSFGSSHVYSALRTGASTPAPFSAGEPELIGSRAVYVLNILGYTEVWSRALDGSDTPIPLSPGTNTQSHGLALSKETGKAAFFYQGNVWSAPVDGHSPALQLTTNVSSLPQDPSFTHAGTRVVFGMGTFPNGNELWSVPVDGSAGAIRLSQPMPSGRNVRGDGYVLSPDGSRAVYLADADTDEVFELYSVNTLGGPIVKLNGPLVSGGDVGDTSHEAQAAVAFSADGSRVVYRADQDQNDVFELYSVPALGGQAPVKLNAPLSGTRDVPLYGFRITSDSTRVVFAADQDVTGQVELWVVPIDGSLAPQQLNPPMVSGGSLLSGPFFARDTFALSPSGRHVFYLADQTSDGVVELFRVPTDGSGVAEVCNGPLVLGGDVTSFALDASARRVLYRADEETDEVYELFLTEFPAPPPPPARSAPAPGRTVSGSVP